MEGHPRTRSRRPEDTRRVRWIADPETGSGRAPGCERGQPDRGTSLVRRIIVSGIAVSDNYLSHTTGEKTRAAATASVKLRNRQVAANSAVADGDRTHARGCSRCSSWTRCSKQREGVLVEVVLDLSELRWPSPLQVGERGNGTARPQIAPMPTAGAAPEPAATLSRSHTTSGKTKNFTATWNPAARSSS